MSGVQQISVSADETGMRLDRWFKTHFPGLNFGRLQKLLRSGQVRVDGARVKTNHRLDAGAVVRVPPLDDDAQAPKPPRQERARSESPLSKLILHEDETLMVLNKPHGLASQGGPGVSRHVDGMLDTLRDAKGQKPRLVHRLDKDTSGCLVVAKTRLAASALAKTFRSRSARKIYWALVVGAPKPPQGKISTWLKRHGPKGDERMIVARHGDEGADHAVTHYAVIESAARRYAWMSLKPVTGRTHQLRVHMQHLGTPILGDPRYFDRQNFEFPAGLQNKLHLLARRITLPHPDGGTLDVTAPLPPHMQQSCAVLGMNPANMSEDMFEQD
ncbi:MAG: RluA family pseudouridine synthase [Pseudomonadota bacterium]